jgi:hypothetical protein
MSLLVPTAVSIPMTLHLHVEIHIFGVGQTKAFSFDPAFRLPDRCFLAFLHLFFIPQLYEYIYLV